MADEINPSQLESIQSYTQRGIFGFQEPDFSEHEEDCDCVDCEMEKEKTK